ncbi:MAG: transcriptional regulator [Clostridia bacterium]|nr:transcriptional regulator [Clostridia bacterium]MBP3503052.1 transcriptional regulator [Clostridia bacterium]
MKNYERILSLKLFNVDDVCKLTGNINTAKSLIRNLLANGYIKRIKHNLYAVCDIEHKSVIADQYMIASKIKEDSYISYHSAFDYYGVKNQMFYTVYVSSKNKFENFEFDGYDYTFINSRYNFGIVQKEKVRVTDKERTVIDCIDKTGLAGGDEELLLCLELMGKLDGDKILEYLKHYHSKKLYAKVGFMLELLKDSFGVDKKVIEECKKNINDKRYYFDNETKRNENKCINRWNLIVPKIFLTRGGTLHW